MFHCIVLRYSRGGRRLGNLLDASQHSVFTYFTPQNPPPSLQTLQILLIFTLFWGKTVSFTFEEFGNRSLFMLFWKLVVLSFVCAVTKKVHGSHPGFWAIVRFWSNNEWRSKWYTIKQGDSYTSCPAKKLIWLCQEILNKMKWPIRIKASFKTSGQKMKRKHCNRDVNQFKPNSKTSFKTFKGSL